MLELQKNQPCSAAVPESSTNNSKPACNKGEDPRKAVEESLMKGSPGKARIVSASGNPKSKSQVLQSNTPNAGRQKYPTFLQRLRFPSSL